MYIYICFLNKQYPDNKKHWNEIQLQKQLQVLDLLTI